MNLVHFMFIKNIVHGPDVFPITSIVHGLVFYSTYNDLPLSPVYNHFREFLDGVAKHKRRFAKWSTESRKSSAVSRSSNKASSRPSSAVNQTSNVADTEILQNGRYGPFHSYVLFCTFSGIKS